MTSCPFVVLFQYKHISPFVFSVFPFCHRLVVSTSAFNCLERLVMLSPKWAIMCWVFSFGRTWIDETDCESKFLLRCSVKMMLFNGSVNLLSDVFVVKMASCSLSVSACFCLRCLCVLLHSLCLGCVYASSYWPFCLIEINDKKWINENWTTSVPQSLFID